MNNKLLETIKNNNEELKIVWANWFFKMDSQGITMYREPRPVDIHKIEENLKSHLQKSRIKELEALIKILEKEKRNTNGHYSSVISYSTDTGYNLALGNIIKILKETKEAIEKLN